MISPPTSPSSPLSLATAELLLSRMPCDGLHPAPYTSSSSDAFSAASVLRRPPFLPTIEVLDLMAATLSYTGPFLHGRAAAAVERYGTNGGSVISPSLLSNIGIPPPNDLFSMEDQPSEAALWVEDAMYWNPFIVVTNTSTVARASGALQRQANPHEVVRFNILDYLKFFIEVEFVRVLSISDGFLGFLGYSKRALNR